MILWPVLRWGGPPFMLNSEEPLQSNEFWTRKGLARHYYVNKAYGFSSAVISEEPARSAGGLDVRVNFTLINAGRLSGSYSVGLGRDFIGPVMSRPEDAQITDLLKPDKVEWGGLGAFGATGFWSTPEDPYTSSVLIGSDEWITGTASGTAPFEPNGPGNVQSTKVYAFFDLKTRTDREMLFALKSHPKTKFAPFINASFAEYSVQGSSGAGTMGIDNLIRLYWVLETKFIDPATTKTVEPIDGGFRQTITKQKTVQCGSGESTAANPLDCRFYVDSGAGEMPPPSQGLFLNCYSSLEELTLNEDDPIAPTPEIDANVQGTGIVLSPFVRWDEYQWE